VQIRRCGPNPSQYTRLELTRQSELIVEITRATKRAFSAVDSALARVEQLQQAAAALDKASGNGAPPVPLRAVN